MSKLDYSHKAEVGKNRSGEDVRANFEDIGHATANITSQNIEPSSICTRHLAGAQAVGPSGPVGKPFKEVETLAEVSTVNSVGPVGAFTSIFPSTNLTIHPRVGVPVLVLVCVPMQVSDVTANGGNAQATIGIRLDGAAFLGAENVSLDFGCIPAYATSAGANYQETSYIRCFAMFISTATTHNLSVVTRSNTTNVDFRHFHSTLTAIVLDT